MAKSPTRKKFKGSVPKSKTPSRRSTGTKKRTIRVLPLKANIVEQPPETSLSRKGLNLRQLLRTTPKFRVETGRYEVTIKKFKKNKTKSGLPALTAIANHKDPFLPNKTIKDREVYIIGLDSQTKPVTKQKRVMVSCNCLVGDTRVLTSSGWKTMASISGKHVPGNYPIEYLIDGQAHSGSVPYYKGSSEVYSIRLEDGNRITGTLDHRFLAFDIESNSTQWVVLKDLKPGMYLSTKYSNSDSYKSIQSIEYEGEQDVYDITVPGIECFVVDGNIIAHNCEDWVFHGGEYACALHGAARIIYGNGKPPVMTNPGNVPYLCKHLVGFAYYCMDKGL